MKFKLSAGAEIDVLTRQELNDTLRSWMAEVTRGARYRRRALQGVVSAAGTLALGDRGDDDTGPAEGFVWAVTRLATAGLTGTETVTAYVNEIADFQVVASQLVGTVSLSDNALVLAGGDRLLIGGTALTVGATITVTAQIKEVPSVMAWMLG